MKRTTMLSLMIVMTFASCRNDNPPADEFRYVSEKFADLQILRYKVPSFEQLTLSEKKLLYYMYEAALSGRDMIYDQNYKYNLTVRRTLEGIARSYSGDRSKEEFQKFMVYVKRVWFANGIHHHYSADKMLPEFSSRYFADLVRNSPGEIFPLRDGETLDVFIERLTPILFDPAVAPKRVNKNPGVDLVVASANNYYEGVTEKEAEEFYARMIDPKDTQPVSYGLNSKLVKEGGKVREKTWKVGGMYSAALEKCVGWLEKAADVSADPQQQETLRKLIAYYQTGDLRMFDEYSVAWVRDTASTIDLIHGFIETYGDALGYRGAYESVVSFVDPVATRRIAAIGKEAQWFEDNSPIMPEYRKGRVTGISANVITVVVESGDASPSTPVGINLPNANWIRADYGSKSVSLGNINDSYDEAGRMSGMLEEFGFSEEQNELERKYGVLAGNLHTDMHEVIGHASGKLNPGVGTPQETLKNYASTIEEGRADLVALYYMPDPRMVEIGVAPATDVGKAEYISYIRNGLIWQLRRIRLGDNIEEDHMRNRQMVSEWVYEQGLPDNVIEKVVRDGKTFFVIRDFEKLRDLFGRLLREVQRITSEGDYEAARDLVERYGVQVDPDLHKEVLERYTRLDVAPYSGFINPRLVPVMEGGEITDVRIEYPEDFTAQMLEYAAGYSFLPNEN